MNTACGAKGCESTICGQHGCPNNTIVACGTDGCQNTIRASCPGHWHAQFSLVIEGHNVTFQDPHFYLEGPSEGVPNAMPTSSHMHRGEPGEWHFEPSPAQCVQMASANTFIGLRLDDGYLLLSGPHDNIPLEGAHPGTMQGANWTVSASEPLAAYHQLVGAAWKPLSIHALNARQLQDGEKVLVMYGAYSQEDVRDHENAVPPPKDFASNYGYQHNGTAPPYPPA
ncbi:MAG: hypothetical protein ACYDBQ_05035 [Thermoplasmatota archaeon]